MSQWQPIETPPEDGTKVLICGFGPRGNYFVTDALYEDGLFLMFDQALDCYMHECTAPSRWMPFPPPPEAA